MGRSESAPRFNPAGTQLGEVASDTPHDGGTALHAPRAVSVAVEPEPLTRPLRVDVRHDLRHAAATILLLLATIREEARDPATTTAYDGIAQCARTIASMVDDDGDDEAHLAEPVALDEVARFAVRRASLLYTGVMRCDTRPATALATNADIARLFANLIENSCRAAGAQGTVEVRVRARSKWCKLQVGDSGTGFVETLGPRGIGLSSVAAIAVRLGGFVTFGQSSLGGALVTVNLPRYVAAGGRHGSSRRRSP